jgi:hypothetical protein
MPRRAICIAAALVALTGCNFNAVNPTSTDSLAGTWVGSATDLAVTLTTSQSGSVVSGSGQVISGASEYALTVTGTSAPPNIALTMTYVDGAATDTITYVGTYVTADSVTGTWQQGLTPIALSLALQ